MQRLSDSGMKPMYVYVLEFIIVLMGVAHRFLPQYAQPVSKKGTKAAAAAAEEKKEGEEKKLSNHAQRALTERRKGAYRFF
jgi:hypothetical protein